jgi:cysteine-rich repeat protein
MRLERTFIGFVGLAILGVATPARAVQQPAHLMGRPALEVASGPAVRTARLLRWHGTPPAALAGWRALRAELGPATSAVWDPATGVPSRIWGAGIELPNSLASASAAEKLVRGFLSRHLELLAPGALAGDFVLVSNDLDAGMRTLGFVQTAGGMPVIGGQVSFRIKNDRLFMIGSEALPHVDVLAPTQLVSSDVARSAAESWVLSDVASHAQATSVDGPVVLPLVSHAAVRFATVMRVAVTADQPVGQWAVYVDAATGAPMAREQLLRFGAGTVLYNTPERWPGSTRLDYPAAYASVDVDGNSLTSDASGGVTWSGTAQAPVLARAQGTYVTVDNQAGGQASESLQLADGGTTVWNAVGSETIDAQVTAYIHADRVKEYARGFAPSLTFLDELLQVNVNIDDECNAFYSGQNETLNFFLSSSSCSNTARLPDVIYHEFGHAIHHHAIIPGVGQTEGSLGEGVSDYLAATITGDPAMGRGFYKTNAPLRHIDPANGENQWPDDLGEVHHGGLVIGGTLWDLRKLLIAKHGESTGIGISDQLCYQAQRRAVDMPTMYFETLAADDTDGNLDNGTPNVCEINEAYGMHGLRQVTASVSDLAVQPPGMDDYEVTLTVTGLFEMCPADTAAKAELIWRLREQPTTGGNLAMVKSADQFTAMVPVQADGTVVQYRVELTLGDGAVVIYPHNAADRYYEFFVGHVEPIYCTDFATDPQVDGWTHALESGSQQQGADDWQWGQPEGLAGSGDPDAAYSGDKVFGNDLGGGEWDGKYQPEKVNYALSPMVDTSGYDYVRLQYRRWLNVEDGFYDKATIYANGDNVWTNFNSSAEEASTIHHQDQEWRFHDVDLTDQVVAHEVALKFQMATDQGLHFGGWTLDDFCVVGWVPTVCGDGEVTGDEECDEGDSNSDSTADACRTDCTEANCGDAVTDSGEECDDGNAINGDGCETDCTRGAGGGTGGSGTGGTGGGPAGASSEPIYVDQGCGCRLPGPAEDSRYPLWPWLLGLPLALWRRRR